MPSPIARGPGSRRRGPLPPHVGRPRWCSPRVAPRRRVARRVVKGKGVDPASVLRAALELYRARQYPGVAAVCLEAIETQPDNLYLRLLRARALLALRNDQEAQ